MSFEPEACSAQPNLGSIRPINCHICEFRSYACYCYLPSYSYKLHFHDFPSYSHYCDFPSYAHYRFHRDLPSYGSLSIYLNLPPFPTTGKRFKPPLPFPLGKWQTVLRFSLLRHLSSRSYFFPSFWSRSHQYLQFGSSLLQWSLRNGTLCFRCRSLQFSFSSSTPSSSPSLRLQDSTTRPRIRGRSD